MILTSRIARLLGIGLTAGALACSGDSLVLPDQGRTSKVAIFSGDAQSGPAGAALFNDLVVLVTDATGRPVAGQAVVFTPGAGNGSVDPDTVVTDGAGRAATQWVLGPATGEQHVQAAPIVNGALATDLAVSFAATALAGNAARLAFLVPPSNVVAGVAMTPAVQVEVQDQNGNRVTNATTPVTLTLASNPSGATLGGGGPVSAVNGVATFANLTLNRSGAGYTLTASATGFVAAASAAFNVSAAAPHHLEWALSGSVPAGAAIPSAKVTVRDALDNAVVSPSISITVAIQDNPSGGTLSGTKTVATVNGVASFTNLSIDRTGNNYTLMASGGGLSLESGALNIIPGDSKRLVFQVQPTNSTVGATLNTVKVAVLDANGNLVTSATNAITLVSSEAGTLAGTNTVTASGGVAQFSNVRITQAGTGYTLRAFSSGAEPPADATSNAFDVAKGATTIDITSNLSSATVVGQAVTVNYDVDPVAPAGGNFTGSVTLSDGSVSCVGTVSNTGSGSCQLPFGTAGTHTITATYAGDLNFTGSTSASVSHPVNKASPALNITSDSPDPSRVGQLVTVQWTFPTSGAPATGVVHVSMAGDPATCEASITSGSCSFTPTTPGTGTQRVITADYAGDDNYNGDSDTENHAVQLAATTTTITDLNPNPSGVLQAVTVSVSVTTGSGLTPTGTISVRLNGVQKCTIEAPTGSCQISGLNFVLGGNFTISANYPGDGQHAASSDAEEQVVNNSAPTANDDAWSTNEDGGALVVAAPGVLQNDTDAGDLTAALVSGPSHAASFTLHADGSFTYTPDADFNGTETFTYRANDGQNNSNVATVTITVNAVNDAPSFTKGADVPVTTADGAQTIPNWATGMSPGPANESAQAPSLSFHTSNDNTALFAPGGEPTIDADGTLHFTPAGIEGTATVTASLSDNGGTANGGADTSAPQTFVITVGPPPPSEP